MEAATRAALRIRSGERSSLYAYPVRSPAITRTPTPMETPWVALLTMDSSMPMELVSRYSKYRSA